jgi:hypothetical protein
LRVVVAEGEEATAHEALLDRVAKASGGNVLFRRV